MYYAATALQLVRLNQEIRAAEADLAQLNEENDPYEETGFEIYQYVKPLYRPRSRCIRALRSGRYCD